MRGSKTKIADVARQSGVSKSTISNYLNGRFTSMSLATRERIEATIRALNYVPDITARRLSSKIKCHVVCLVIGFSIAETFKTTYYPTVLRRIGQVAAEAGYRTLIYTREGTKLQEDIDYLKGLASSMADGFILFDLLEDDPYFLEFEKAGIPYVCVGKYDGIDDNNFVATDHGGAVREAVDHLAALGHERIGLILEGGPSVVSVTRRRAFTEAMRAHGLEERPAYISVITMHSGGRGEENYAPIKRILKMAEPPTAMIVPGNAAYEIERVVREHGKRVPQDMSMLAVDYTSSPYAIRQRNYTHLTSEAGNVSEIAFRHLLAFLENPEKPFVSEMVPARFVLGETTDRPPEEEVR